MFTKLQEEVLTYVYTLSHTHIDIHIYLIDRVLFMLHHIHEKERLYFTKGTCFRPVHNEEEEILQEYKL